MYEFHILFQSLKDTMRRMKHAPQGWMLLRTVIPMYPMAQQMESSYIVVVITPYRAFIRK